MAWTYPDERYYYSWIGEPPLTPVPNDADIKSAVVNRLRENPQTEDCHIAVDVKQLDVVNRNPPLLGLERLNGLARSRRAHCCHDRCVLAWREKRYGENASEKHQHDLGVIPCEDAAYRIALQLGRAEERFIP